MNKTAGKLYFNLMNIFLSADFPFRPLDLPHSKAT
jgi:hypothetical protein